MSAESPRAILQDEYTTQPLVLPHDLGVQNISQPATFLSLGLPIDGDQPFNLNTTQIHVQTDAVDGESGYIRPSDPTGANGPIPSQINDVSGSIAIAPKPFEDPSQAGSAPPVSSVDLYDGHTASSASAGSVQAVDIPHQLPDNVPHAPARGNARSSSTTSPATPRARPTRSRRKVKQHNGEKTEKRRGGDKKEKQKDGERKVKRKDRAEEVKQQDGEKISFRGRCAPRHKSGDIWVMGTMSGLTIDNPLQKGVKAWQDPLLMDEWNGEKAKRSPKLALFEEIVEFSVDSPTYGGEGKKRERDDDDEAEVAPTPKKARMARASGDNAKGNGSKVSSNGTSTGTVTLAQEPYKTSGSAVNGEGPSTDAYHTFLLGPHEG